MGIKSLQNIDFDIIYKAFSIAFADYEIQLNKIQLESMLKRRGFDPNLSFAVFENNEIVSFTLNGIGEYNGIKTAYDTGTGTIKEYRGKGLATKIFEYSIPFLKQNNIKQYLLEVLQYNTKAINVYKKLKFEVSREFNYFVQKNEEIDCEVKNGFSNYLVKQFGLEIFELDLDFCDFYPSWQNSFDSIKRANDCFVFLGVFNDKKLIGYCVFEPDSGDITQIAVDKQYRRKGIATLLLKEAIKLNKNDSIKIVNTEISCNSITDFLKKNNITISGKQFEMIRKI